MPAFNIKSLPPTKNKVGRPFKTFSESGKKSRKSKARDLTQSYSPEELGLATGCSLASAGFRKAGKLVENISIEPTLVNQVGVVHNEPDTEESMYTPDEALAFLCHNGFSKAQYVNVRMMTLDKGVKMIPSYNHIRDAKAKCSPDGKLSYMKISNAIMHYSFLRISIQSFVAQVPLQQLVDHTVQRLWKNLCLHTRHDFSSEDDIHLMIKWGCDGSSNHARYKQVFLEKDDTEENAIREYGNSHIFALSLVPLRLTRQKMSSLTKDIIWNNNLPSSVSLCRPIKLIFQKEAADLTRGEVKDMETQIRDLRHTECEAGEKKILVKVDMIFCMVDTKVVNDVTRTNSQSCYICGESGLIFTIN